MSFDLLQILYRNFSESGDLRFSGSQVVSSNSFLVFGMSILKVYVPHTNDLSSFFRSIFARDLLDIGTNFSLGSDYGIVFASNSFFLVIWFCICFSFSSTSSSSNAIYFSNSSISASIQSHFSSSNYSHR